MLYVVKFVCGEVISGDVISIKMVHGEAEFMTLQGVKTFHFMTIIMQYKQLLTP